MHHAVAAKQAALQAFIKRPKFGAEGFYTGVADPAERRQFEAAINALARKALALASQPDPKPALMAAFKAAWLPFDLADTEDREKALQYFEDIMTALDVESSDGLLNQLMYGFDPGQTAASRNAEALAAMSEDERAFVKALEAQPRDTVRAFMTGKLGAPTDARGETTLWLRGERSDIAYSLTVTPSRVLVTWMAPGRFVYTHEM